MVEEPVDATPGVPADAQLLTTPSGKQYTAAQLHNRSDATMTPGGTHTAAFFTAQHLVDRREQQLQLLQQDSGSNRPPLLQQLLGVSQQHQQTMELLMSRLQGTEQPPAAAGTASNEALQLQELRQALQATQQQVQDLAQALQQRQHQSAANLQVQQLDARSSHYTSRMGGGVDPIAEVSMPYISSNPQLQAVLGAAKSSSLLPRSSDSGNLAGAILAALDMREARLVRAVVAALRGSPDSSNPAMVAATAAAVGGSASATDAVLPMGRLGSVGCVATGNAAAPVTTARAAAAGVAAAAWSKPKEKFFPDLSSHASLSELAEWYYVQSYRNTGKTPQQLEVDGRGDKQQWRGGHRHRIQRWNEYVQLLRAIEQQRSAMQDERRRSSHNAHCVATVDEVSAARELDRQRERLGLSVCEYRQYIAPEPSSKGYKKAKAKEQQLLEAAGEGAAADAAAAEGAADTHAGDDAPMSPPLGVVQQQEQHRQTSARGQQRGRGGRGRGRAR
jgi:hypothetical protein